MVVGVREGLCEGGETVGSSKVNQCTRRGRAGTYRILPKLPYCRYVLEVKSKISHGPLPCHRSGARRQRSSYGTKSLILLQDDALRFLWQLKRQR